jgi:hypothetical protein
MFPAGEGYGMDERQTLRILAWSIGGLFGVVFLLNALALAAIP